ncbi:MAG: RnfABCDGE type electron transport complex subunit D [Defluviitaleaceae bacterium]|nr:RnfABCDGE type electron transport complex subunit D [Defluviitaleaceae bacterium]
MKFLSKHSPFMRNANTTQEILNIVLFSLIFVLIWSFVNIYFVFGTIVLLHGISMVVVSCIFAILSHVFFHFFTMKKENYKDSKAKFTYIYKKTKEGVPIITALILTMCLPLGTPLYVVIVATIFAEIFVKLMFGGFGFNIFNPALSGFIFAVISFSSIVSPYIPDAITSSTPLGIMNGTNWGIGARDYPNLIHNVVALFGGYSNMIFGTMPGAIAENARFAIILAFIYMGYKKVIDIFIPIFYIGTIFIVTWILGIHLGFGIEYPTTHILTGAIFFAAVFMATDPVTNPINRQGRIIFSIFFATLTMILRLFSNHNEAVGYSLLLMNTCVPLIDRHTANVTMKDLNKKKLSIVISMAVSFVVVFVFLFFYQ